MVQLAMTILPWLITFLVVATVIFIGAELYEKRQRGHLALDLGMALFLVRVPRYKNTDPGAPAEDPKQAIGLAEQIYAAAAAMPRGSFWKRFIYGTPHLVFEIVSALTEDEIGFYVAMPRTQESHFAKTLQGVYPDANLQRVTADYTLFQSGFDAAAAGLLLKRSAYLPLQTYAQLAADPLGQVTNVLSKLGPEEGGAVQILVEPNPGRWRKRGGKILNLMRGGKSLDESLKRTTRWGTIWHNLKPKPEPKKDEAPAEPHPVDEATLELLQAKQKKVTLRAVVRLVATTAQAGGAEQILGQLKSAFGQYDSAQGNAFRTVDYKGRGVKNFAREFIFRRFNGREAMILNVEELASLWHLGLAGLKTPKLKWLKVREVAPPAELPHEGPLVLGKTVYRGEETRVCYATPEDRRRHLYIVGQTGTGKSGFLSELIRQDIEAGHGVAVIDPHGELVEETLANIPRERAEDVIVFEPFDMARPMGLNMLEWSVDEEKDFAVQEMIAIFYKLFPPEIIGPMFEHYMRNAMLVIMADKTNPGTLVEVPRLFTDEAFLKERLQSVHDPIVRQFWEQEWAQTTGKTRSDMLGYVVSKLGRFVENDMMRNIIGQNRSGVDLSEVMNSGKIFLANLSKGRTGEVNASLLGLILVTKLQMAALKRSNIAESERRDFYLYIDEFQNFTTDSIATILSEARKYKLDLIIAHQYIGQLTDKIRDAVFGNVGSMAVMRVGADDAEVLERQLAPEFNKQDLVNLNNFSAVVRLMIRGMIYHPFLMFTYPPQKGNSRIVEPLKRLAKLKYGRPREVVEDEIRRRARLG